MCAKEELHGGIYEWGNRSVASLQHWKIDKNLKNRESFCPWLYNDESQTTKFQKLFAYKFAELIWKSNYWRQQGTGSFLAKWVIIERRLIYGKYFEGQVVLPTCDGPFAASTAAAGFLEMMSFCVPFWAFPPFAPEFRSSLKNCCLRCTVIWKCVIV